MDSTRLAGLIERFPTKKVLVIGDYFLDEYLSIDRKLSEVSLETNLEVYQVIKTTCSPGAAGNAAANLASLGINVIALGVFGLDGKGYELKRALLDRGINVDSIVEETDFRTPTYIKPMICESDGTVHEIERIDIKNRVLLPSAVEDILIQRLRELVPQVDGVMVIDQVQESNCGVITDRVRGEIEMLALRHPNVVFAVDSRNRMAKYQHLIAKPNLQEAMRVFNLDWTGEKQLELAIDCGKKLYERMKKPVYLTLGEKGVLLFTDREPELIPAIPVEGEIDIVGAGDSCFTGMVSALCSGAENAEAALIGNLVSSITIKQIGTTGTATPAQLIQQFDRVFGKVETGSFDQEKTMVQS